MSNWQGNLSRVVQKFKTLISKTKFALPYFSNKYNSFLKYEELPFYFNALNRIVDLL